MCKITASQSSAVRHSNELLSLGELGFDESSFEELKMPRTFTSKRSTLHQPLPIDIWLPEAPVQGILPLGILGHVVDEYADPYLHNRCEHPRKEDVHEAQLHHMLRPKARDQSG